jgi:DNA polymerase-3 subunit alpha/error-prone DNA polymerase
MWPAPYRGHHDDIGERHIWKNYGVEYAALKFLRNLHPLALWKNGIETVKRIKAAWLPKYIGGSVKLIGWPITQKEVWTKDGLAMSFLSFEDETGMYETVIFLHAYEKYHTLLFDKQPLVVYGKAVDDHGALILEVGKIETLREKMAGSSLAV